MKVFGSILITFIVLLFFWMGAFFGKAFLSKQEPQYIPAECINTDLSFCATNEYGIVIKGTIHFPATGGIVYPDMTNKE